MPRLPRQHVPGGCYHVILRGNHREPLFDTAGDRLVLNDIAAEATERFGARIHAFCWMTNHLHSLVQISNQPLGNFVKSMAQRYSRYRHKRLCTGGHLFERRHIAKLVLTDANFLALVRYIHMNPVKAGVVEHPADYPWTSHRAFLGAETINWLTTDFGLSLFSKEVCHARMAYRRFMLEPVGEDEPDFDQDLPPKDSRDLGTDGFVSKLAAAPLLNRTPLSLEELAEEVCNEYRTTTDLLRSPLRTNSISRVRVEFARRALNGRAASLSGISRFLHRNPSSVTRLLERNCDASKEQKGQK